MSNQKECKGNCPNTCKVHGGEYVFCTNEGCLCHKTMETMKERFERLWKHDSMFSEEPDRESLYRFIEQEISRAVAEREANIRQRLIDEVIVKCPCSEGYCENCKRLFPIIDDIASITEGKS